MAEQGGATRGKASAEQGRAEQGHAMALQRSALVPPTKMGDRKAAQIRPIIRFYFAVFAPLTGLDAVSGTIGSTTATGSSKTG
jgi:hypothetical protein